MSVEGIGKAYNLEIEHLLQQKISSYNIAEINLAKKILEFHGDR